MFHHEKVLYRVGWSTQEIEDGLMELRLLLARTLRTVPIGFFLVWITSFYLGKWGSSLPVVEWALPLFGPLLVLPYYIIAIFDKSEFVLSDRKVRSTGYFGKLFHWRYVKKARLVQYMDGVGGRLEISNKFGESHTFQLPKKTDLAAIVQVAQINLGDRFVHVTEKKQAT